MYSSSRLSPVHQLATWVNNQVAVLYPGCFALVMATGIISNALFFEGYRGWADVLFAINLVAYPCLVLLTVLRSGWFSRALWADLINPRLVFSFFTIVAGTDVFGIGIHLRGFATVALLMWLFALAVWFVLIISVLQC
jgi:voltage-gated anion channel